MTLNWQTITSKIEALNHRERWMVLMAGMVVIYAVFNTMLVNPVLDKKATVLGELAQSQTQTAVLKQQLVVFSQHPVENPDAQNQLTLKTLTEQIHTQNAAIKALNNKLVSPEAMTYLLKKLLHKSTSLHLVAMQTLSPEDIASEKQTEAKATPTANEIKIGLFKHGVKMTIAGNYLDLLQYVTALEQLPMQIYMGESALQAKEYPQSELTMTLYTLSLEQAWLTI